MARLHIKNEDEVVVIAGSEKGRRGKVLKIYSGKQRAIVEGLNMIKKHVRKNQQNPEGAIVEREGTIHVSNLMKADKYDARAAKKSSATEPTKD